MTRSDARLSLPEVIFAVVSEALADARCTMDDIDGIVIAAHDLIDGRSLSSMITGPAAGAYLRDEIRVSEDGLVAISLAAARIQAGEAARVVVAAWGRPGEGDVERSSRAAFDPFTEQPLALSETVVSALRAAAYLREHSARGREAAAAARQERAAANPRRAPAAGARPPVYPLRPEEMGVPADVAAAVVLGTGAGPRITGVGHGTEPARLGERTLAALPGARAAVAAALARSGLRAHQLDLVELGGPTLFDEVLQLEAAGLAEPGTGLAGYAAGTWVNPSGGAAAGDCHPCGGLLRFVEAVRRRPGKALVVAGSAVASQTTTAVIIEEP
ncbi:hypothetical protein [Acrocarpospora macrocephala]|nr:hypothetical protein [Acrocarpospora macrocephala]